MRRIFLGLMIASSLLLSACADEQVKVLNSPCAGTEGSPCGPKRAVNGKSGETAQLTEQKRNA